MKTKKSIFLLFAIVLVCMLSYLFHQPQETSKVENRTLMTFGMVFNPPPSDSIVYKDTASERLEEALKDQFFCRDWISVHYTNFSAFLENFYSKCVDNISKKSAQQDSEINVDADLDCVETDAVCNEADAGFMEADADIIEADIDFTRWPCYGLPRLEILTVQDYYATKIGNQFRFNETDYLFEGPIVSSPDQVQVEKHAEQIQHIHELYPDINFYSYFVSSLSSTKWFDGMLGYDTIDYFESIAQLMPDYMKVKRLIYQDESDYERMFYKSDHHWCYVGFMQGYEDIYNMLSEDYENLSAVKEPEVIWNFSTLYDVKYRGSRARILQGLYDAYDEFIVPEYDLGDRTCYSIDLDTGRKTPVTLCLWDTYKNGNMSNDRYYDHYINFYYSAFDKDGNDLSNEYYLIQNENANTGHNLLFVTDSTGRAIRDVLGSHFDSEVYLDYRNMSSVKVDKIIEEYNIDTIVMNGLGSVWTEKEYSFHFSDGFGEEN